MKRSPEMPAIGNLRMRSGVLIDVLNLDPAKVYISDIAYGLAGTYRYARQSRLTVAQHSVLGCEFFLARKEPILAYEFLMHDVPEWLSGDVPAPVKYLPGMTETRRMESEWSMTLAGIFGFTYPKPHEVDTVDKRLRVTEQRDLFHREPRESDDFEPLCGMKVNVWTSEHAEQQFLHYFSVLAPPSVQRRTTQRSVA